MAEDKGFKPSKRRLSEAQRDGKLIRATTLVSGAAVTICFIYVIWAASANWVRFQMLLEYSSRAGFSDPYRALSIWVREGISILLPALLVSSLGAIAVERRISGGGWVGLKLKGLDLVGGLKRLAGAIPSIGGIALKFIGLSLLGWYLIARVAERFSQLGMFSHSSMRKLVESEITLALIWCSAALILIGAIEFLWRWKQRLRELSMSRDEVMREHREDEGDPMIRAMRRSLHQALVRQDLVRRVRRSKVIVVQRQHS